MTRAQNHLAENSIVANAYPGISICRRGELREITIPAVGDISFAPTKRARTLFLGSSVGAFRMFVDDWSEVHITARSYDGGARFTYTVEVRS